MILEDCKPYLFKINGYHLTGGQITDQFECENSAAAEKMLAKKMTGRFNFANYNPGTKQLKMGITSGGYMSFPKPKADQNSTIYLIGGQIAQNWFEMYQTEVAHGDT